MNKKEAIEIIKKNWPDSRYTMLREALQTLIPELKESEDEKIRNFLIGFIKACRWAEKEDQGWPSKEECIAWIEKQSEQKSQCKSAFELWKDMRFEVYQQASGNRHEPNCSDDSTKMFSLNDIDEIFEKIAENQGEQKVINEYNEHELTSYEIEKWNEAYEKGYNIGYMNGKNEQKPTDAIAEMKQVEWSEEDEKMCQETIDWFEKKCFPYALENENPARESIKWLKSLKDRVQTQPKQVWSEDDEYQINTILHGLDLKRELYKKEGNQVEENRYSTQYTWLKSLKDRVQPKQELNEEDEKMLNKIIEELTPYGECPDYPSQEEQEYYYTRQEMIDWLQSLKEKIHPNKE